MRRAGPLDAELVAALGAATYREHFADFWTPAGLERFLARQFDPATLAAELAGDDVRYELAEAGGTPIGYAKTLRARDVPTRTATRGRELQKIYFRADATGAGPGGVLLEHVVAVARADGEPRVWLQVLEANEGAARFYVRHGFAEIGRFDFAADRGPAGMRVMVRELAQSRS